MSTTPLRSILCVALLCLIAETPIAQTHTLPSEGVIFDEFLYTDTTITINEISNSIFGPNDWCTSNELDNCGKSEYTDFNRAWYSHYWIDWQPFNGAYPSTNFVTEDDWPGTFTITHNEGTHYRGERTPQVASGFSASTGVWAAAVKFSDLSAEYASDPEDYFRVLQSFWTYSPHHALINGTEVDASHTPPAPPEGIFPFSNYGGAEWSWAEMDHEFNNWFHWTGPSPRMFMGNAFFAEGRSDDDDGYDAFCDNLDDATNPDPIPWVPVNVSENGTVIPMTAPSWPGGDRLGCHRCKFLLPGETMPSNPTDDSGFHMGTLDECAALIGNTFPVPNVAEGPVFDNVVVYLLIRNDGDRARFELVSHGWGGLILMESDWFTGAVPQQEMMAMFSSYVGGFDSGGTVEAQQTQSMEVDWFYYTPDAERNSNDILADVQHIRSNVVYRLNSTGMRLERPYDLEDVPSNIECHSDELDHDIDDPLTITVLRSLNAAEAGEAVIRLSHGSMPAVGDYRIEWREKIHHVSSDTWSGWSDWFPLSGYRASFGAAPPQYDHRAVEVRAQRLRYCQYDDNLPPDGTIDRAEWTRSSNTNDYAVVTLSIPGPEARPATGTSAEPLEFNVGAPYPNPAGSEAQINLALPEASEVYVTVQDILGREVMRQNEGVLEIGAHTRRIDLQGLPPGHYIVTVQAGSHREIRQLTIVR